MKFPFIATFLGLSCLGVSLSAHAALTVEELSKAKILKLNETQDMGLEDLMKVYTLGASKFPQLKEEAPASINIITQQEIRRYGYRNLAEVLSSLPGFFLHYDNIYHSLGTRGFLTAGDFGSRLLVLLDGKKVNGNLIGAPSLGSDFVQDLDLIERIEVIHGPSSSLYGSGAFFGVVNISTKKGKSLGGTQVSASVLDNGALQSRVSHGGSSGKDLDYLFTVSLLDDPGDDEYIAHFDNPESSTTGGVANKKNGEHFEKLYARVIYKDWTLSAGYKNRVKGSSIPYIGGVFNSSTEGKDVKAYLNLAWKHEFDEHLSTEARVSYNYELYRGFYYPQVDPEHDKTTIFDHDRESDTGRSLNAEWRLDWKKGAHHLVGGVEVQKHSQHFLKNDQLNTDPITAFEYRFEQQFWSVFLQDEYKINDQFILNAGLRYDHYDDIGSTTNPRLALIYKHNKQHTFKLLAGSAFRAPSTYEAYYDDPAWIKRNSNLKAETVEAYEAVWEGRLDNGIQGMVSAYRYKVEDMIGFNFDFNDFLVFVDNLNEVKGQGLDVEFQKRWKNGWDAGISYSYQDIENVDKGQRMLGSPKSLLKFRLGIPLPQQWTAGLEVRYRSRVTAYKAPYDVLPSFTQTNLTLSRDFGKDLKVSASVYNVFDTDAVYPLSTQFEQDRYIDSGRSFRLKASYRF